MCALVIVGAILVIVLNVNYALAQMEERLTVNVYLEDEITEEQRTFVETQLNNNSYVQGVQFISKQQAWHIAVEMFKSTPHILEGYTEETHPFPEEFVVTLKSADSIVIVRDFAEQIPGVRRATYGDTSVELLLSFMSFVNNTSIILVIILSVIAVVIIVNTIKLTVFSRRNDITIMKYVGATNWYIRVPFVIEGAVLGLLGSIVSIMFIRNIYYFAVGYMQSSLVTMPLNASLAPISTVMMQISVIFIAYGILLGTIGSTLSMKRFLKV